MLAICECSVLRISRGLPFSLILQVPKKSYTMVLGDKEKSLALYLGMKIRLLFTAFLF